MSDDRTTDPLMDALDKVDADPALQAQREVAWKERMNKLETTETTARRRVGQVCALCTKAHGGVWPPGHLATMCMDNCDVCGMPEAVCSPGDWDWPYGRPQNWTGGRD